MCCWWVQAAGTCGTRDPACILSDLADSVTCVQSFPSELEATTLSAETTACPLDEA